MQEKKKNVCQTHPCSFRSVVLALVGAVSASVCGTETTRCDLANACATCLPNPSLCVESAPDASGIITLTTRVNQNFGAAITGLPWSYPAGVRIVVDNNAGVTFGSASSNTIRLCIPSGRTISTTAFITANGGVVSMAGNVELVTSSVVPNNALTFLNANTASSNWLGLFASIKSVEATVAGTTPNPCFTTVASASYNTGECCFSFPPSLDC